VSIYSFNPWFVYDYKYFGFGSGFHLGKIEMEPATNERGFVWWPVEFRLQGMFRIGLKKILFADAGLNEDHFGLGPSVFRYGIGSGFGTEFLNCSTGFFKGNNERGMYLRGAFHIGKSILLEPQALFAGNEGVSNAGFKNISLRLHYKINHSFSNH
jgi:hypothetical protein